MDSQIAHSHDHDHDHNPHNMIGHPSVEGDAAEHHHEKKSVIKKVKEKAKKIKNTITKHGLGHDNEHDSGQDYHDDLDEEEDEDEEMVEDPEREVTGAIRQGGMREDPSAPILDRSEAFSAGKYESSAADPTNSYVAGPKESAGKSKVNLERTGGLEQDPHAPKSRPGEYTYSSNYQTKVTDPTGRGGEEAEITPILRSLGKMNIYGEPEQKHNIPPGSNIQFSYSSTGSHGQFSPELIPVETPENPQPPQEGLPHGTEDEKTEKNHSNYTQKISSATSAISDKAISAKNFVVSKFGYGEKDKDRQDEKQQTHDGGGDKKISCTGAQKGVSAKDYFSEKLRPGAEDRVLSEVISDALHKRARSMGKVTESEEVERRLGTEDEDNGQSSKVNSQGSSVVEKLKGSVRSWLGSKDDSKQSLGSSNGNEGFSGSASREAGHEGEIGEQNLQEPGN